MTEPAHQDRLYKDSLEEAAKVLGSLHSLEEQLRIAAGWCVDAFRSGHKLLACGNGGSASEAQHLVGEIVGRYKKNRPPLPAIALTSDSTLLTCIGNDYDFREIFSRQVEGLGKPGDVLVVFTTSGNSPNILAAMDAGRKLQMRSIAFLGRDGGQALRAADCSLLVAHPDTARVQEGHNFLMHALMDRIEADMDYA
jgi:D-sedoheptulose 7-phosphate isomerase